MSEAGFVPDAWALRRTDAKGRSYGNFQWPLELGAIVTAPDWSPTPKCGGGLHGLPDGLGDYGLLGYGHGRIWWVVGFIRAEAVDLDDKVKFPRCRVEYFGPMAGAMNLISQHCIKRMLELAKGNTATGYSGHAAATGDRGHAAATGDSGHAAATGDRGHAAVAGRNAVAAAVGYAATACAAEGGAICLAAYDGDFNLVSVRAALVGQEGIEPGVTYRLTVDGRFERVGVS